MARLTNTNTGAVVEVRDEKVEAMGSEWVPVKAEKKAPAKKSFDLVVKNCRVGEDVPINTHTLQEFCDAEFNSPWEEFSLVMELLENHHGPKDLKVKTQRPLGIYVPPEKMQACQSARSRSKINRIRAKHPGIDLDILKQYKLICEWIHGSNLIEVFHHIDINQDEMIGHLTKINYKALGALNRKGYLMADMKPEHVIFGVEDASSSAEMGITETAGACTRQLEMVYQFINEGRYSIIDYELLLRTPEHEEEVKQTRRYSYLDDQRRRRFHGMSCLSLTVPVLCKGIRLDRQRGHLKYA